MKLGHELKPARTILYKLAIHMTDTVQKELLKTCAQDFQHLHHTEWGKKVTRHALVAMQAKKTYKTLPFTQDLKVCKTFIEVHTSVAWTVIVSLTSTKCLSNKRHTIERNKFVHITQQPFIVIVKPRRGDVEKDHITWNGRCIEKQQSLQVYNHIHVHEN